MAQFDVIALRSGALVIDCQSDLLSGIGTRFVVPLNRPEDAPPNRPRLNPSFEIAGETRLMITQFAGAVAASELGPIIASLKHAEFTIKDALDMLLTGV